MYKSQFRKIDPYDWFCGPGSNFLKRQGFDEAWAFIWRLVEQCPASGKMQSSSLSLFGQLTNHSGGAGLIPHQPTVTPCCTMSLWLNNNGEINIAGLQILISFPDGISEPPQY